MRFTHLLFSSLLPALALTAHLSITIPPSNQLPNPASLSPSTSASLTTISTTYSVPLNSANAFSFRNITAGSYLLSVSCPTHAFAPLRIDVSADGAVAAWPTYRGNEWNHKGEELTVGEGNVLEVRVLAGKEYYMARQGCEYLQSPMFNQSD
jgi:hypothetical protein